MKTRKIGMILLVTFLIGCMVFAGRMSLKNDNSSQNLYNTESVQNGLSDALIALLDESSDENHGADVMGDRRLSQKLTVITEEGVLSVGGTVTKAQDAFYPGTYEVKFSKNAILTSAAKVQVAMDVKRGDRVYVLIGDKENGYTEYASVVATEDNKISFSTNVLQDYTLSTTDINSAQEAMADIFSSGYSN